MAKPITLSPQFIDEYFDKLKEKYHNHRMVTGGLQINEKFEKEGHATLFFTDEAYMKEKWLVYSNDKEIAWHGVVRRGEGKYEYIVEDILLFKQTVSGTTVNTDQEEYEKFLDNLDDDTFNALKYHGHSHVNMGVSPSGVDTAMYDGFIRQLGPDQFYVFTINNKKGERKILIYDMADNIMFEDKDVDIKVYSADGGFFDFMQDAKACVKETKTYSGYNYSGYWGGGYGSTYYGGSSYNNTAGASVSTTVKSGGGVDIPKVKDKGKSSATSGVSGDITKYHKGKKPSYQDDYSDYGSDYYDY